MSLNQVVTGNTILAADVNQLVAVLQRSSGSTEVGSYYLSITSAASGNLFGYWINSESRGATPVSVTLDTSLQAATNFGTPSADHLTANGFHVYAFTSAVAASCNVGGLYTIQY